ncbi:MAG TPA: GNAT family N-acetyltransferase [Firmicutes bacterium]|nr:GNAT family N-acetyltransferase [Bacillota bacterium]
MAFVTKNTPKLETERLILRKFTKYDANAMYDILKDDEANTFLPWFPAKNIHEAKIHLKEKYLDKYANDIGFHYAVCIKESNMPVGYINISDDDSHDLGYGLRKEYWHKGIMTEACRAVADIIKNTELKYITATHDINNPRSGEVMKKIGMIYKYSYEELVQPKNMLVTFRMYQLNLDGHTERIYKKLSSCGRRLHSYFHLRKIWG